MNTKNMKTGEYREEKYTGEIYWALASVALLSLVPMLVMSLVPVV